MGVPIDDRVIAYAFPNGIPAAPEKPPPFVRAVPTNGTKLKFIGVVREIQTTTKRNKELAQLGQTGWKMIGLTGAMHFWQITVADNSKSPQQTYTALVPDEFSQNGISRDQLAFVALRGVDLGSFSAWIVTFLAPAK